MDTAILMFLFTFNAFILGLMIGDFTSKKNEQ